ncbi:helix-turn-helix transcriptional regulator [Erysipelotrichaceae bacterium HCN-30851]
MKLHDEKVIQQRIVGYIIRQERKKYKMKMTDFVEEFGKTRQYYSKIEHGETALSFSTLQLIFDYLGISFDYSYYYEINDLFDDFIDYLFFSEYKEATDKLHEILSHENWKYSYSYPKVLLAEMFLKIMKEKPLHPINKSDFQLLESFYEEGQYLSLFYLCIGYSCFLRNELETAIEWFHHALHYAETLPLQGLCYLWLAIVNTMIHQYVYALEYSQKASQISKQENNPQKDIIIQYYIGEIFSSLLYPKHAIKSFKTCITIAKRLHREEWIKKAYIRLTWNALYSNDYNLVIQYGLAANNYFQDSNISFCLSYAYFMLDYQEEAQKYFNEINSKDKLLYLYKELLENLFAQDTSKQVNSLQKIYDYTSKYELYPNYVFSCKALKELALQKQDYKEASRYVEDIIMLRKQIGAKQKVEYEII